jgi:hypothetical protein
MQKVQLYIIDNNIEKRVDLFKDEKVSLTQTIQNVKDIAKIFTAFSKTFAVPASKANNILFSHYYNFNIIEGYDARVKKQARLYLNNIPFKEGTIKLTSVKLKNNVAHTYNITFFGNTVNLVDLLGDLQLDALTDLNKYNVTYDKDTVYDYIRNFDTPALNTPDNLCVPLISHTDRMFYNSAVVNQYGNVYVGSSGNSGNGIKWTNFKYAIRLSAFIDAIQAQTFQNQTITFSDDFFNDDTNLQFHNLFMWLHRKKGGLDADNQIQASTSILDDLVMTQNGGFNNAIVTNGVLRLQNTGQNNPQIPLLQLDLTPTNSVNYTVRIISNQQGEIFNFTGSGTQSFTIPNAMQYNFNTLTVVFETNAILTFAPNTIVWTVTATSEITTQAGVITVGGTFIFKNANTYATTLDVDFAINQQVPEIKIIDFLTGLFKMFNLTAYVDNQGTIVVQKLDDYYALGQANPTKVFDKYVDTTKSEVALALPFKDIKYAYEGLDTFLAKQFNQLNNAQWGSLDYSLDNAIFDALTESYAITIPFEHMMFERLYNATGSGSTTIQWGWFVDDNQESYLGKPLLFYPIRITSGTNIQLLETDGGNFNTTNQYIVPSNSQTLLAPTASGGSTNNIHFQAELNEWWANEAGSTASEYTGTLFNDFYTTYITDVFNSQRRLTKLDIKIPLSEFFNLELYDIISINQNTYKINSITTDLQTGKSKVELLNSVV